MKVLQISKFYPPVMGGIESVAWELTEGLNQVGIQTDVLCSSQQLTTNRARSPDGYEVVRAGSMGMLLSTSMAPSMVYQLRRMACDRDVIHLHMPNPMAAMAFWMTRPKTRLVVHWHSDVIRQRKAFKIYEPLQRWLLARASAIIATSDAYAGSSESLKPWLGKVSVIPIGISDNASRSSRDKVKAIRQLFRRRHIVFSLGRVTYYKGFDVLIQAAAALPDDCTVVIGGDGELLDDYRTMVRRGGLAGKVHLLGHISDDDLPSYYDACDVFCMPSTLRAEAYGVAILEAMVMRKPIVATDIAGSGVPWVNLHGATGLNVPVRRPELLADVLRRLLEDESLRMRLGDGARHRYVESFNAKLMIKRTLELYERLPMAA